MLEIGDYVHFYERILQDRYKNYRRNKTCVQG